MQLSVKADSKRSVAPAADGGNETRTAYDNATFDVDCFDYEYQASSPDEKALVEACRRFKPFIYIYVFIYIKICFVFK